MKNRVIHTGQAIVDLVMEVGRIPEPGGDTFARRYEFTAGGGFNVMSAAARDGAEVLYAGGHGTGPFGDTVRAAMTAAGITVLAPVNSVRDTGFCVALVDDSAERTFVSTLGAEGDVTAENYRKASPRPGDVVYMSGYSLLHHASRDALLEWLPELPTDTTVVVDPSPIVEEIPANVLRNVIRHTSIWSTNTREAMNTARLLGSPIPSNMDLAGQAVHLAQLLACSIVLRAGAEGAATVEWSRESQTIQATSYTPALTVEAIDTNGAGDSHCGVLCAALAAGSDIATAVQRANISSGLAVSRRGPATSPTTAEINALLPAAMGSIPDKLHSTV
ncbi:PfkB family carbohydrate kinase [Pseudarthrobacter sp. R1]|uniref:PfkB family carbohydrate kinase n=1 Tax=Pseudarthrobacter sp. R1 TaxID=2944934 RepID=UPI00210C1FD9|nr:PfkB family carbohydrate kinase [Pseudarthrobacter sp. R1]MCQ6272291.1 PfkB family carbohydrate kinase [Pseudarthrobacter sp. R1]